MTAEKIEVLKTTISKEEIFRLCQITYERIKSLRREIIVPNIQGEILKQVLEEYGYSPDLVSYIYDEYGSLQEIISKIKNIMNQLKHRVNNVEISRQRRTGQREKNISRVYKGQGLPSPANEVLDEKARTEMIRRGENPDLDL